MTVLPDHVEVAVVGAGLAGLAAARVLAAAGREVAVLEASDGVGGRVRTDIVDGFQLDRGFQVLLTAYPEAKRQLDLAALDLQPFRPGAIVWMGGRGYLVSDPFRDPRGVLATLRAPIGTLADKARIAALRRRVLRGDPGDLVRSGADLPTITALRAAGFSSRIIERFFRPLVAGIQLDPSLETSSRMFDVIFAMLAKGDSTLPAAGMGAIPRQLASHLPAGTVHLGSEVQGVEGTVIRLSGGRSLDVDAVVIATEGPAAARLLGLPPVAGNAVSCCWFAAPVAPVPDAAVLLDGDGTGPATNVVVHSNVAPSYAPAGQALIAAACPGPHEPAGLADAVQAQLRGWFGTQVDDWRHLRTDTIAFAQPTQRPPLHPKRPVALGELRFVCGDHRDTASIQGALFSGRRCGEAVAAALA